MMIYYVVLGIGILTGIGGQMLLKAGADAPTLVGQLLRPSTLLGLALYGSAAFLYIFALRKIPVSVAFPSVSLSYAIVAVLVLAGVQLIVVGVIGEYLGRMFLAANRKPQYLVREVFRRGAGGLEIERPPVNTQAAGQPYRVPSQPEAGR